MGTPVIVETARTPIGRAYKGSLVDVRADDLGGMAIAGLLERVPGLDPATVEDVMVGCGLTHHEQGFNVGRIVSLLGGLPDTVPGTTVNRFCASSLQTIRMAAHAIWSGEGKDLHRRRRRVDLPLLRQGIRLRRPEPALHRRSRGPISSTRSTSRWG